MKNRIFQLAIAAVVLMPAAITAQGGQGAGKVNVHDISITKNSNALLAFPGFQGGVRVAAGDVNSDGRAELQKAAKNGSGGTFTVTFDGQTTTRAGAARLSSSNNLKQLGIAMHSAKAVMLSFLQPTGDGEFKEVATYKLHDVTLKRGVIGARSGGDRPTESLSLNFTKAEFKNTPMGSTNGGVWKTTNFLSPEQTRILIGMLLPAVQKVR